MEQVALCVALRKFAVAVAVAVAAAVDGGSKTTRQSRHDDDGNNDGDDDDDEDDDVADCVGISWHQLLLLFLLQRMRLSRQRKCPDS